MNTTPITRSDYEAKAGQYFEYSRSEMVRFVPAHCRRVLDVGCGAGTFGESLKQTRGIEVWGVELVMSAAAKARTKLDRVIDGPFDPENGLPTATFDCIVFNDVLEHMVNPEQALRYAKVLLSPVGAVVASIPNIRHLPTFWQLLAHGRWEYTDCGVLDKTHLRFFTKHSILNMFQREGYEVEAICGINATGASRRLLAAFEIANVFFLKKFADMKFRQFAIVAKPSSSPGLMS